MPRRSGTRLLGLAGACVLIAGFVGCGGEDGGEKIPTAAGQAMLDTASQIELATASGDCDGAQSSTTELRGQVDALPPETDPEIVDGLDQMVSRLDEQLNAECAETGTSEPTTTSPEEETAPTTTTTAPTTTETTTTEEPPPEEGDEGEDGGPSEQPPAQGGAPPGQPPGPPAAGGTPSGGVEEGE